jgi:hypothetical protein
MKDLLTVREYEYKGIKVLVEIDRVKGQISLVETNDRDYGDRYPGKQWLFKDRTIDYAKSWLTILDAMKYAVEEGIKELQLVEAQSYEELAELAMALKPEVPKLKVSDGN